MIDVRDEYVKALRAIPPTVEALVAGGDDGTARIRPEPGEWAPVEIVAHLADVDERALARVGRHGEHGRVTIENYEAHCAANDVDHLAQIARTLGAVRDG